MEVIAAGAAWAIANTCRNVPSARDWLGMMCSRGSEAEELARKLSDTAQVYLPGSEEFKGATARWSTKDLPDVSIVVVPSTADDVAETVKFANSVKMPFLAQSGGHGATRSIGEMKDGIEIYMREFNNIEIAKDGKTVTIGGGVITKDLIDALWAAGKQTVTGACECTSIMGPALGGGHGLLQGRYGLVSDQLVSMNVVLADGSMQAIDESSDLWWAMQGAGHNFGIVTSATMKIYDVKHKDWAVQTFIFPGTAVEKVYELLNKHLAKDGKPPVDITNFSIMMNIPDIDPDNAVIMLAILQEGATAVDNKYLEPFNKLGPIFTESQSGPYTDVPKWIVLDKDSRACNNDGLVGLRYSVDVNTEYDIPAMRKLYDYHNKATHDTPALKESLVFIEGYSLDAFQAVPSESTAFPNREDNVIYLIYVTYAPDGPELDAKAHELGKGGRDILQEASGREELHAYVNYAVGYESLESMYGHEKWRLEKLRGLKDKYDPDRKFGFYAPIS